MHELPQIQEMFDDVVHELIVALAARCTATKEVFCCFSVSISQPG
jgi:hypothetical protein